MFKVNNKDTRTNERDVNFYGTSENYRNFFKFHASQLIFSSLVGHVYRFVYLL